MKTIRKSALEELFEGFDWSDRLDDETISTSSWTIDAGLSYGTPTFDDTSTEIEITGGTVNTTYQCQNLITSSGGAKYQRSFKVIVVVR
jgi:hypothetical protein